MKIDSTKNYLNEAYGIIVFEGSGSVDGATTQGEQLFPLKGAGLFSVIEKGNYIVVVKNTIGDLHIPLNKVTNQVTWLNTAEGRDKAWADILGWIKECEADGSLTGDMTVSGTVEVSNFPTTSNVIDYNDFDHDYTHDSDSNMLTDVFKERGTATVVKTITRTYDANGNKLTENTTLPVS
ncbi:MAG: hypothetical protein ACOYMF_05350 [Bacteroidales bacterium]